MKGRKKKTPPVSQKISGLFLLGLELLSLEPYCFLEHSYMHLFYRKKNLFSLGATF